MPDTNHSGKFWALVTLAGAVLSSPLLLHVTNRSGGSERPNPIEVVVRMPLQEAPKTEQKAISTVATSLYDGDRVAPPAPPPPSAPASVGPAASQRYLSTTELEGYSNWQLSIARNEIYARHGRRFRRADLQRHFDAQPWYRPVYGPDEFTDAQLNAFERYNANLIADYQRQRYGGP
ncbi:MAG TPA: YARHG domain-containing protein [Longimicrobium sp.]|nr:YARHG domain-containing protein [Longimicrobium sp.]